MHTKRIIEIPIQKEIKIFSGIAKLLIITFLAALIISNHALSITKMQMPEGMQEDVVITAIEINGNYEVRDETILNVITSKTSEPISMEKLETDLEKVYDLGFFSEDIKATLSEFEGGAKVVFRVVENPVLDDIVITGNTKISTEEILNKMMIKKNTILNNNDLKKDVETIEQIYKDRKYRAAMVADINVDSNKKLKIQIMEGLIENIKLSFIKKKDDEEHGSTEEAKPITESPAGKTKDYVVYREMKIKHGDVFNTDTVEKDLQRIFNLGFFEDVKTRIEPGKEPGYIVLYVELEEARTGQAGVGAGYGSNTGLAGFITLSERNLYGKGRKADIKLEFGGKRNSFELGYFEPWLDKKHTSMDLSLYNTLQQNFRYGLGGIYSPDYEETHNGFAFTVGRPLTDYTRLYVGLKTESVTVTPKTYNLDGNSRSMTVSLRKDTRDNIFNPSTGLYDSVSTEFNGGFLGGDFTYTKIDFDVRHFKKIKAKQVLAGRMLLGLGKGEIPRFDWYDLGGVNTLRGYEENQFGGTKFFLLNSEYRFNLSGNLSGVLFGDAGNAWSTLSDVKLTKLHKSIGAGLRLKIPAFGVGPVRLDFAYSIDTHDSQIHFGIGHMF